MAKTIVIVGTLDTKGEEVEYLKKLIQRRGHKTIVVDTGILGEAPFPPDISRDQVAEAAGVDLKEMIATDDEGKAMATMGQGASRIARELYSSGQLDGVVALGGSMGTTLGIALMKALPLTMPKLMVSTVAFTPLIPKEEVGKDLTVMPSVVDLWGLSRTTRRVLQNAAGAITGMVETYEKEEVNQKPVIGITTLGTASCKYILWAKPLLEEKGYEVEVFHTNGIGGSTYEEFVEQGLLDGALDFSISELVTHLCIGDLLGVANRLEAAGKRPFPQVVSVGVANWIAWGPLETLPPEFRNRKTFLHNPSTSGIELTKDEIALVGKTVASRLNSALGPTVLLIPARGFSERDRPGALYYDPEVCHVLIETLKSNVGPSVRLVELDLHINDPEFSERAVAILDDMLKGKTKAPGAPG